MESILTSIKRLLGIEAEETHFDPEIIMHINSVFSTLTQLGVGPAEGFSIEDETSTWNDFLFEFDPKMHSVKSYMSMRVKLMWDTSTTPAAVIASMERQIAEFEWRLNSAADYKS